jgi:hypothetical protein
LGICEGKRDIRYQLSDIRKRAANGEGRPGGEEERKSSPQREQRAAELAENPEESTGFGKMKLRRN